jgi:hypothetical protein
MDRLERIEHPQEALLSALQGNQLNIWTALPGIIQEVNLDEKTCSVQPCIQAQLEDEITGTYTDVNLPLLLDCPILFPSGGGCTLTFPVANGDECLVIFASRCIDAWWQSGGIQKQAEFRMHSLSDGFAIPGISSVPKVPPFISNTEAALRSFDGETIVAVNPTAKTVRVAAPNGMTVLGDLVVTGTIRSMEDVIADSVHLKTHVHSGVSTGGSNTGGPV